MPIHESRVSGAAYDGSSKQDTPCVMRGRVNMGDVGDVHSGGDAGVCVCACVCVCVCV